MRCNDVGFFLHVIINQCEVRSHCIMMTSTIHMLEVSNVAIFIVVRKTNASSYWWDGVGPLHTSLLDIFIVMHKIFATHDMIFYKLPILSCQIKS